MAAAIGYLGLLWFGFVMRETLQRPGQQQVQQEQQHTSSDTAADNRPIPMGPLVRDDDSDTGDGSGDQQTTSL